MEESPTPQQYPNTAGPTRTRINIQRKVSIGEKVNEISDQGV